MAETRSRTRRTWLIVGGCLLAVVAVVLGVAGRGEEDKPESLLPEELSADSLKAQAAEELSPELKQEAYAARYFEYFTDIPEDSLADFYLGAETSDEDEKP